MWLNVIYAKLKLSHMHCDAGQGCSCLGTTHRVSQISRVVCFCRVRCSLFQAANRSVVPLTRSVWRCLVGCCYSQSCRGCLCALLRACGSRLVAHPGITARFGRHHLQAHLLAMSLTHIKCKCGYQCQSDRAVNKIHIVRVIHYITSH